MLKQTLPAEWTGHMRLSLSNAVAFEAPTGGDPIDLAQTTYANATLPRTVYLAGDGCGMGEAKFAVVNLADCATNIPLRIFGVNATLDGVAENDEETPGGFIADRTTHTNAPRTALALEAFGPAASQGTLDLTWDPSLIQMYSAPDGGTPLQQYSVPFANFTSTTLHVEGIAPGSNVLHWTYSEQTNCVDRILVTIIKVDTVEIYKPETDTDAEWQNVANVMDWKEVIRSDEDLKFKIKFTQVINSKDQFPCDIKFDTFVDDSPLWVTIPINGDDKLSQDKKELWMTVPNGELKSYGFIPNVEEDSEWEYCSFESTGSGNFNDSDQFDTDIAGGLCKPRVNTRGPGNWTDTAITWSGKTVPAWSADGANDTEYLKAGGGVYIEIKSGGESDRGILQDQADWFYISGHGSHTAGTLCGVAAVDVDWNKDLQWVFMAGCSVCDIDDLNGNYDDGESPGEDWATTGPDYFLGYNWFAPADDHSGDPMFTAKIIEKYFQHRVYYTYWESWKRANEDMAGGWSDSPYNACFIRVTDSTYFYFDRGLYIPVWTSYSY